MVINIHLAQVMSALATLGLSSGTSVQAATVLKREDPSANTKMESYYYKGLPEADMPKDEAKASLYREQALSIATFSDVDTKPWAWYFDKTEVATKVKNGDPGYGCQVALYFDAIEARYNNYMEVTNGISWARPSVMAPWCNSTLDFIENNTYPDASLGFQVTRPSTDTTIYPSMIMLLSTLDASRGNLTATAEAFDVHFTSDGTDNPIPSDEQEKFITELKSIVQKEHNNYVPNPYKYGKNSEVWTRMRQDILNHNNVIPNIKNGTAPISDSSTTATASSMSKTGSIALSGTTLTRDGTRPVTITDTTATATSAVGHTTIYTEVTHITDTTAQAAKPSG